MLFVRSDGATPHKVSAEPTSNPTVAELTKVVELTAVGKKECKALAR